MRRSIEVYTCRIRRQFYKDRLSRKKEQSHPRDSHTSLNTHRQSFQCHGRGRKKSSALCFRDAREKGVAGIGDARGVILFLEQMWGIGVFVIRFENWLGKNVENRSD